MQVKVQSTVKSTVDLKSTESIYICDDDDVKFVGDRDQT